MIRVVNGLNRSLCWKKLAGMRQPSSSCRSFCLCSRGPYFCMDLPTARHSSRSTEREHKENVRNKLAATNRFKSTAAYEMASTSSVRSASQKLDVRIGVGESTASKVNNTIPNPNRYPSSVSQSEIRRLLHIRNVGIFAHVDAGKTTVTERMLALAGIVDRAGNVDDGNTVTDYLPAERERGITIQAAAVRFPWAFHNAQAGDFANDSVTIALIDTPGHVDFSVEVNRSVAVLDGAVLVVDAAAGVQAQTQTVWRAMTRPTLLHNCEPQQPQQQTRHKSTQDHSHEPLPCLAVINKMDKVGADFFAAVDSLRNKLPGANPIPIQLPIFRMDSSYSPDHLLSGLVVAQPNNSTTISEDFAGVVDLIHMRAVIWPYCSNSSHASLVENCIPTVVPLWNADHELIDPECPLTQAAVAGRFEMIEALAEVDGTIEELYLNEQEPSSSDARQAIRRATLSQRALPVLASAAVQGKGIEPCLDAIADFLPSPVDRMAPALSTLRDTQDCQQPNANPKTNQHTACTNYPDKVKLGHCFHPSLLALAFKVVHMKGRGGSGDGRVVFCRVYSGTLQTRDSVQIISPPALGESAQPPRMEKVGGMLQMAGGRFDNMEDGEARSGDVCALVGLKSVVTGDTIMLAPQKNRKASKEQQHHLEPSFCAGVAAPKPVLTVKLEAESATEQARLGEALSLLSIEDPSLFVEETDSSTLLSGLGELHIEITLDRLRREHGLQVMVGTPSVAYRETLLSTVETEGMVNFDRTIGNTRLQASISLVIEPLFQEISDGNCRVLTDPIVVVSDNVLAFLGFGDHQGPIEELESKSDTIRALVQGCRGALKRGPSGYGMANVVCKVIGLHAEDGLAGIHAVPGSLRAAAAHIIKELLDKNKTHSCAVLEPKMSVELSLPNEMVGSVLSDLTARRGTVSEVLLGDSDGKTEKKAFICGEVPLIEILGYAGSLRSMTGGEGSFTSEYKGHAPCKL